jgi:hypothetical protein
LSSWLESRPHVDVVADCTRTLAKPICVADLLEWTEDIVCAHRMELARKHQLHAMCVEGLPSPKDWAAAVKHTVRCHKLWPRTLVDAPHVSAILERGLAC